MASTAEAPPTFIPRLSWTRLTHLLPQQKAAIEKLGKESNASSSKDAGSLGQLVRPAPGSKENGSTSAGAGPVTSDTGGEQRVIHSGQHKGPHGSTKDLKACDHVAATSSHVPDKPGEQLLHGFEPSDGAGLSETIGPNPSSSSLEKQTKERVKGVSVPPQSGKPREKVTDGFIAPRNIGDFSNDTKTDSEAALESPVLKSMPFSKNIDELLLDSQCVRMELRTMRGKVSTPSNAEADAWDAWGSWRMPISLRASLPQVRARVRARAAAQVAAILEEMHDSRQKRPHSAPSQHVRYPEASTPKQKGAKTFGHRSPSAMQRAEVQKRQRSNEKQRRTKKQEPHRDADRGQSVQTEKKQPLVVKIPTANTKSKANRGSSKSSEKLASNQRMSMGKHDREVAAVKRKPRKKDISLRRGSKSSSGDDEPTTDEGGGVGLIPEKMSDPVDDEIEALNRLIQTSRKALETPPVVKVFAETEVGRALENLRQELRGIQSV
eukprot:gnl/MRDRNA2_/MRDRNA2_107236_c0_seq1.p1 gnl/MRDRNA2_/MRDRNA2_107236_c0~~gnl/MRDRNA2_/MRDRNA2_107236_c0_seq1.p1  ORF type:complete len:508 (+),score=101.63 gnl/MRDRNA2_/MRDRNA2_107236_c0_seq1:47-1525(+)